MRPTPVLLAAVLLVASSMAPVACQEAEDDTLIRELIAQHELASRNRDLEALVDLYHPGAEMISSTGSRMVGLEAVTDAYRATVEGRAAISGRHHIHPPESTRIRFLRPDVALVEVESHSVGGTGASGDPLPLSRSLLVTVWTREGGKWAVAYQRALPGSP